MAEDVIPESGLRMQQGFPGRHAVVRAYVDVHMGSLFHNEKGLLCFWPEYWRIP